MKRFIHLIKNFELYSSGILVYALLLVSTFSVLSRYILPTSLMWSEELSRYMFMWVAFLSCAYAVQSDSQLAIDLLPTLAFKDKPIAQEALRIFTNIGFLIFAFYLIKYGGMNALNTVELSAALKIPMIFVYSSMPVGGIFISIRLIQDTVRSIGKIGAVAKS